MDELSPELTELYHNNPVVHHAVMLWRTGAVSKEVAYEQAMIYLAKELDEAKAELVKLIRSGTFPPVLSFTPPASREG